MLTEFSLNKKMPVFNAGPEQGLGCWFSKTIEAQKKAHQLSKFSDAE
ncbi:hypothetical protein CYPRO_2647 [Cyclonatronum proteinivorum]|uniref:Uncharacterized protein n=1 Tax=Cyclonatronum proteinivorum TaxID=1457365 RepID=A0A345UN37_9BACT|nr:hypothetical protein CYPRO_2647 [Cyclonatronum proteinivorum]